jgi:peptidoglycan/xylan/chitin deacetylase (PgdA/CDA1 family)
MRLAVCLAFIAFATPALAVPKGLVEPHMHLAPIAGPPEVAMTLDACEGGTDMRILDALIANQVPATIFATGRWIASNPKAVALLKAYPSLFEVEDHGKMHIPAVIGTARPYGLAPAGTANAVFGEVIGGAQAVQAAFGTKPTWYRDATALYSPDALTLIQSMGFRIGGFSLNGDEGASVSAKVAEQRIAAAHNGDVIISHVNQPKRASGAGVVDGILALKAKGFRFVRLEDATEVAG